MYFTNPAGKNAGQRGRATIESKEGPATPARDLEGLGCDRSGPKENERRKEVCYQNAPSYLHFSLLQQTTPKGTSFVCIMCLSSFFVRALCSGELVRTSHDRKEAR